MHDGVRIALAHRPADSRPLIPPDKLAELYGRRRVDSQGFRRVEVRTAAEVVTAELRRAIMTGSLPPHSPISQRTVAAQLDVSAIPVREAIRNLEAEGLVITQSGRTTMVAPLSDEDLSAVYRLRRILEPDLAARAALAMPPGELARLERLGATIWTSRDDEHDIEAAHDFYTGMLAPAATTWDRRLISQLWRAAQRYMVIGVARTGDHEVDRARMLEDHELMLAVFRDRDAEAAAAEIRRHLDLSESVARKALETP